MVLKKITKNKILKILLQTIVNNLRLLLRGDKIIRVYIRRSLCITYTTIFKIYNVK